MAQARLNTACWNFPNFIKIISQRMGNFCFVGMRMADFQPSCQHLVTQLSPTLWKCARIADFPLFVTLFFPRKPVFLYQSYNSQIKILSVFSHISSKLEPTERVYTA